MNQTIAMEEEETNKDLSVEEKLQAHIAFMRAALAQEGSADFKGFWEVRKQCLPLFKEPIPGPVRAQLWDDYIELTREGRRLKGILDEESAFAIEQIELAISALEKEAIDFREDLETVLENQPDIKFPKESATLKPRDAFYRNKQKQLNVLNVHASRINGLRKELIRTDMRIRQKNQFFQRLSELGDHVFPVRKELICEVSDAFVENVNQFVESNFSSENFSHDEVRRSVFFFREEIKTLQSIAKILTLNTHAFSETRENLSQCWDKLRGMEKELKKEYAQQKQKSGENVEQVMERIQAFTTDYAEGKYPLAEGFKELETIAHWMREIELTRNDVRMLKEELSKAREPLEAKQNEEADVRRQKQAEFERVRQEKNTEFKAEVEALAQRVEEGEVETLLNDLEECRKVLASLNLLKVERQQIDRRLKAIRDQIVEKQEQALLDLSDDARATLDSLNSVLEQRKERRKEIKAQVEEYRKISGGSGLDFEKAIRMQELMQAEKERLAKLDEGIKEIETKIRNLKNG